MRFHNKKLRSVISDNIELDVLLVKQAVLNAVSAGCTVVYPSGYALFSTDKGVFIHKTLVNTYIEYLPQQTAPAVDKYFELFLNEDSCDLAQLRFCTKASDVGVRWAVLKRRLNIQDLLTKKAVLHILELLINEYHEAQKTSDGSAEDGGSVTAE